MHFLGQFFFLPGKGIHFGVWIEKAQLKDILYKGKIKTFQELKSKSELLKINEWRYQQLKHLITTIPQPIRTAENLNPIERLCSVQTTLKHVISQIYKILTDLGGSGKTPIQMGRGLK